MEITTIIGIVVAILIMFLGLRMILKKPSDAAPSLDSELHINEDCQKPVIPRHVRDQLQTDTAEAERVEPVFNTADVQLSEEDQKPEPKPVTSETVAAVEDASVLKAELKNSDESDLTSLQKTEDAAVLSEPALSENAVPKEDSAESETETQAVASQTETEQTISETDQTVTDTAEKESSEFSLNEHVEKAEITEFNDESSILDAHLYEQRIVDEESALSTAEDFIALNMYPERRVLAGDKALKVLLKYGLRFGEMACFHRYNEDGTKLLFSVLQITDEGAAGFDLENLSTEQVKGLAFFLALPHSDVQNAFDTMISISGLIAREIDGTVYDQNHLEFTPQLREHWRHQAIDYRHGQKDRSGQKTIA
ncbi:cell division protein ZipA [Acinetobacter chinensis]|uniref:Cell division protein ZipA n=1 Tax=Acinetobacter chinensis TaxID=2004650 RepID=A0A3B7LTS3_9GAMM|nr:cell division protein ZipA C-terminal FtsZ-binding domain-containing protein [Acinetobacter chinensis]AXY55968.1 cell division protein ZipA [Acinetobacter chinensis]MDV2469979.1 cell division protein ZipA C-terminal FtsZ-binding domain-containing protein [Acinetobacter chinensis]